MKNPFNKTEFFPSDWETKRFEQLRDEINTNFNTTDEWKRALSQCRRRVLDSTIQCRSLLGANTLGKAFWRPIQTLFASERLRLGLRADKACTALNTRTEGLTDCALSAHSVSTLDSICVRSVWKFENSSPKTEKLLFISVFHWFLDQKYIQKPFVSFVELNAQTLVFG